MLCPREHPPPLALALESCRGTWVLCSVQSGGGRVERCTRLELAAFEVFTNLAFKILHKYEKCAFTKVLQKNLMILLAPVVHISLSRGLLFFSIQYYFYGTY